MGIGDKRPKMFTFPIKWRKGEKHGENRKQYARLRLGTKKFAESKIIGVMPRGPFTKPDTFYEIFGNLKILYFHPVVGLQRTSKKVDEEFLGVIGDGGRIWEIRKNFDRFGISVKNGVEVFFSFFSKFLGRPSLTLPVPNCLGPHWKNWGDWGWRTNLGNGPKFW